MGRWMGVPYCVTTRSRQLLRIHLPHPSPPCRSSTSWPPPGGIAHTTCGVQQSVLSEAAKAASSSPQAGHSSTVTRPADVARRLQQGYFRGSDLSFRSGYADPRPNGYSIRSKVGLCGVPRVSPRGRLRRVRLLREAL